MEFRHEFKHEVNAGEAVILRQRLKAVMREDAHGTGGVYRVRSLYFDTPDDKALREKINGVDFREKFRLRCYDFDYSFIRLEKKIKQHGLCSKLSLGVSPRTAELLSAGREVPQAEAPSADGSFPDVLSELCFKMRTEGLRPKTLVDYARQAFTFDAGNVRVTLDYDIRTGLFSTDFMDPNCVTVPAGPSRTNFSYAGAPSCILEVKWDRFLPEIVRQAVQINGRRPSAFSKYAACRAYD